jgi:hypothetical protein
MRTLFIAIIAVNEIIGPIFFRQALARAGEIIAPDGPAAPAPAEDPRPSAI